MTPDANPVPDLAFIEKNISTGSYNAADQFDRDVLRLFQVVLLTFLHTLLFVAKDEDL